MVVMEIIGTLIDHLQCFISGVNIGINTIAVSVKVTEYRILFMKGSRDIQFPGITSQQIVITTVAKKNARMVTHAFQQWWSTCGVETSVTTTGWDRHIFILERNSLSEMTCLTAHWNEKKSLIFTFDWQNESDHQTVLWQKTILVSKDIWLLTEMKDKYCSLLLLADHPT